MTDTFEVLFAIACFYYIKSQIGGFKAVLCVVLSAMLPMILRGEIMSGFIRGLGY